jgi:hypothetical protein
MNRKWSTLTYFLGKGRFISEETTKVIRPTRTVRDIKLSILVKRGELVIKLQISETVFINRLIFVIAPT